MQPVCLTNLHSDLCHKNLFVLLDHYYHHCHAIITTTIVIVLIFWLTLVFERFSMVVLGKVRSVGLCQHHNSSPSWQFMTCHIFGSELLIHLVPYEHPGESTHPTSAAGHRRNHAEDGGTPRALLHFSRSVDQGQDVFVAFRRNYTFLSH